MDSLNYKEIKESILEFIKSSVGDKNVLIGLSGGIDSSITCALAVEALGPKRVKVVIVKNSRYPLENLNIARDYAKSLGISIQEIDSTGLRKEALNILQVDEKNVIESSTIDARICDFIIKTVASKNNLIYLGTINGTERLTGWYPKGNLVGDICPIGGLLKEQEKYLAKEMDLSYLIETISDDASRVCSGCGELLEFKGIPYDLLDSILYVYETSPEVDLFNRISKLGVKKEMFDVILNRIKTNKHKDDVFPNYPRINFVVWTMENLKEKILNKIKKNFYKDGLYILSKKNPIFCTQVNGLVNICLSELGLKELAKENLLSFVKSNSFNEKYHLFYTEVNTKGEIVDYNLNSCKNSIIALSLCCAGLIKEADSIMKSLLKSPIYDKKIGLLRREYNSKTKKSNPLMVIQSNLWAALAFIKLGNTKEAIKILENIKKTQYSKKYGLYISIDCRGCSEDETFFADDQALISLCYILLGDTEKAKEIMYRVIKSPLFDPESVLFNRSFNSYFIDTTKSTYKNSLMAFVFGKLGMKEELLNVQNGLLRFLYDSRDELFNQNTKDITKVADNSLLALITLEYKNLKHILF